MSAWMNDDNLCSAAYPAPGRDFGMLCNKAIGHEDNHRALAEVACNYRRHIVWTPTGVVLPDEETSRPDTQGQASPSRTEGDR